MGFDFCSLRLAFRPLDHQHGRQIKTKKIRNLFPELDFRFSLQLPDVVAVVVALEQPPRRRRHPNCLNLK